MCITTRPEKKYINSVTNAKSHFDVQKQEQTETKLEILTPNFEMVMKKNDDITN